MEQQFVTATHIDDDSERPTIPSLRPRQRPKLRKKTPTAPPVAASEAARRPRFDAHAEHFFSNAETVPELVPDPHYFAELARLQGEGPEDTAWWVAQRRGRNVKLVVLLCTACLALLLAGALR